MFYSPNLKSLLAILTHEDLCYLAGGIKDLEDEFAYRLSATARYVISRTVSDHHETRCKDVREQSNHMRVYQHPVFDVFMYNKFLGKLKSTRMEHLGESHWRNFVCLPMWHA
jgi:hypothetical protein